MINLNVTAPAPNTDWDRLFALVTFIQNHKLVVEHMLKIEEMGLKAAEVMAAAKTSTEELEAARAAFRSECKQIKAERSAASEQFEIQCHARDQKINERDAASRALNEQACQDRTAAAHLKATLQIRLDKIKEATA
jgi:hypothetical protein